MVTVTNGVNSNEYEVAGRTVAWVRENSQQMLNIDPQAKAHVGGEEVASTYVLKDGDDLEFVKSSGQKGSK